MTSIDLNSDMGESFGRWTLGDDAAMLELVSSANIACGYHAGDPKVMRQTLAGAAANNVQVGAHVAYRDLAGFGRRDVDVASDDLKAETVYQIGGLRALANTVGASVSYVKPHGALYNRIVHDERQATAVVEAIVELDPDLVLLGLPGGVVLEIAEAAGLRTAAEAFADRAYTPEGTLVSRKQQGAVLHDPQVIADRMLALVQTGTVTAIDGSRVSLRADSICVHGDTEGAVAAARAVRDRLRADGVTINAFAGG